jgi:enediyne biosynthesis protein E4
MGVDFQDYDNDGLPDLVITNLANQRYALYCNNGDSSFTYDSYMSGIGGMTLLHSGWEFDFSTTTTMGVRICWSPKAMIWTQSN